jgi:trans-aconitate 2-methyltransferase
MARQPQVAARGRRTVEDSSARKESTEWDAASYHRLSSPQFSWGLQVLEGLALRGDETVTDAGCGTGRLTVGLLERLPRGRVLAVDLSRNMLEEARSHLAPRFGVRVGFIRVSLAALPFDEAVDEVFRVSAG